MNKKLGVVLVFLFIGLNLVMAQNKMDIIMEDDALAIGEKLNFEVKLLNSANLPVEGEISLVIQDSEKKVTIEKNVPANMIISLDLGEKAPYGYWSINAKYVPENLETNRAFLIEINEIARFELVGDVVIVTNIGNSRYTKSIQILIGEESRAKSVDLGVGESLEFRLIAPNGNYNVRITDGKTTLNKVEVGLTGNVIGIVDQRIAGGSSMASGVKSEQDDAGINSANRIFTWVFVVGVIGAAILLVVERQYRKKLYEAS